MTISFVKRIALSVVTRSWATRLTGTRVGIGDEKDISAAYSSGRNSVRL
jgi:hypothetical protein